MNKHAIVVMAASDTPEGRGRMVHALKTAQGLRAAGTEVQVHFHGIGVTWLTAFAERGDPFTQNYGPLFDEIRPAIAGACDFCAAVRFEAAGGAEALGVPLRGGSGDHHTMAHVVADGWTVLKLLTPAWIHGD